MFFDSKDFSKYDFDMTKMEVFHFFDFSLPLKCHKNLERFNKKL